MVDIYLIKKYKKEGKCKDGKMTEGYFVSNLLG